jgi:glucose/arabinose dehydrogenase
MNFFASNKRLFISVIVAGLLSACNGNDPESAQYGNSPELPEPQRGLLPAMTIAQPAPWGDQQPTVPQGYSVSAIATDLKVPRQMLVLPNGDILIAEGKGGNAPALKPKDIIAGYIKSKGTTSVESGDRLTLLRDADGDGTYELRTVFADNLNAPYGLALVDNNLYVANQDALVRFDYREGQTEASGAPTKVTDLPSRINHHWTKALTASADGRLLYVGIGSNSNITERGMIAEVDRAMIWEVNAETGAHRPYATGLRNPTALTIQPGTGQLWAVVNERDEIGPNLVPDYLTSVQEGGFYGWPYSYWGQHVDDRVRPQDPQKVASAITPDMRWDRMLRHSVSTFPKPAWARNSPMVCSSACTVAGIVKIRWGIRWSLCPFATAAPTASRWISLPAFAATTVKPAAARWASR